MSKETKGRDESYHSLLMEYASGCLDEAHALVIAAHMALSPSARKYVAQYEEIGGSLLQKCCSPVAMKPDALKCVMDKLESVSESACKTVKAAGPCAGRPKLNMTNFQGVPACLESYMETATWKQTKDGFETIHIRTTCSGSTAEMVKLSPGKSIEPRSHGVTEITLVLQGGARDAGTDYTRGDLIIIEQDGPHTLLAHDADGAVFFVVRPSSSPLHRMMKNVLSYFHR